MRQRLQPGAEMMNVREAARSFSAGLRQILDDLGLADKVEVRDS